jgi:hypothetical protein
MQHDAGFERLKNMIISASFWVIENVVGSHKQQQPEGYPSG